MEILKKILIIMIFGYIVLSLGCGSSDKTGIQKEGNKGQSFDSNGEQIYFTGTSMRGTGISSQGLMHLDQMTCAGCHGQDGKGRTIQTQLGTFKSSDIRYKVLTAETHTHGEEEEETHTHERVHPPYDDETLKQAMTEGIDPAGNRLNRFMPRWTLSGEDLSDLVDFLKTLE